jgi:hypothetical protein
MDKLPRTEVYRKYLQIASIRFSLPLDECRNRYGLYTEKQWMELLTEIDTWCAFDDPSLTEELGNIGSDL